MEHTTEKLAELIAKRQRCLLQLRDLGRKQSEMIEAGEMGPLLRLISAKNQLIVAVQALEQELEPFHQQDPDQREWKSKAAREECARQANACRQLLEEVMQLERDNEQRMTERRDQVAAQLQAAQAASVARGAYQTQQMPRAKAGPPSAIPPSTNPKVISGSQLDLHSEA